MYGPDLIARTLSVSRPFGSKKAPSFLQYHSRSDHHSKLACWCIAFDLLLTSSLLRRHAADGKITIGVNHEMLDFRQRRKKDLDLVIARPAPHSGTRSVTLASLADSIGVVLEGHERDVFAALPVVGVQPAGSVLVALEAKACMTEHGKSEARLYDELNSSQQTVHGANDAAIACGLVMVNIADSFISPGRQTPGLPPVATLHKQPAVTRGVVERIRQLPRRTQPGSDGFDALGIMVLELRNDGSPVALAHSDPAPQLGSGESYHDMVARVAALYDYRWSNL